MDRSRLVALALALAVAAALGGCRQSARLSFDFVAEVPATGSVYFETENGAVRVEVDPTTDVVYGRVDVVASGYKEKSSARTAAAAVELVESGTPADLTYAVALPPHSTGRTFEVGLDLLVPPGVDVSVVTSNAPITVIGTSVFSLRTTNGSVDLVDTGNAAEIRTTNGGVGVDGHSGDLDVRTTNGGLGLYAVRGNVRASTTNGFVEARLTPPDGGDVSLATTNGGVDLAVPYDFGAQLSCTTTNGDIYVEDLDLFIGYAEPGTLEGELYDGAGFLDVRTTNADIRLHRR